MDLTQKPPESGVWRRSLEGWARALFDGIDDAVFVHDLDGRILDVNAAACRRLGYSHDELLRMNTRDIDDPDFASGFTNRLEQQKLEGRLRCEGRHRTKDGKLIPVDINTSLIDFKGKPCILAVMRDSTEHQRAEHALRESQAFYHSLVESLPQNLFRKDREGRVTFGNQRYCALLGKSLEELIGKTDFDLFPEHLARKYVEDDRRVLETGRPLELVEEHNLPDGSKIYVEVIKNPILDNTGQIIGTQGLFWDVTVRFKAELAVAASEQRYRQLTEATLDAIILADHRGRITLFNPAAEKLFGYTAIEVMDQPLTLLMPEDYHARHQHGMERYIETRAAQVIGKPVEMEGLRKDGVRFPLELVLTAIPPEEGEPPTRLKFLGAIRDLTERNRMRSSLVQNEKLASIGLLSAGVAHEINNPLAFVGNNVAVLQRDLAGVMQILELYRQAHDQVRAAAPELAGQIEQIVEDIDLAYIQDNMTRLITRTREGVERVAKIVQSLRGLARTGKPQRQVASLPDLVDAGLEMVRNRLRRLNIQVETKYDPNPTLNCVPTQISQVLLNLLVNATQAIEAMNRPDNNWIRIHIKRLSEEMLIQIADNGCGIKQENVAQIFDPFFTTKDVGEGTGLGLSITHNIITGHGGRVEVNSSPGQGTFFRILLPLNPT